MSIQLTLTTFVCAIGALTIPAGLALGGDDAYADAVVSYVPGNSPAGSYTNPQTTLGEPERNTGEGVFPGVVSMYNPPWLDTELVSIGTDGSLTLQFATPVTDDPANPFGIDLLIFGNGFFIDSGGGITGVVVEGGIVEVSPDNVNWEEVSGVSADGLYPTQGYADTGPFDASPGSVPCDYTRPVNPAWAASDFVGRTYEEAVMMYQGSGGGAPIDLAGTGFSAISFVRISNIVEGVNIEIDAIADVAPGVLGDATGDAFVDVDDLVAVILQWGGLEINTSADFDGNGAVDIDDLVVVILNWTT